jgi:hypothetical protein
MSSWEDFQRESLNGDDNVLLEVTPNYNQQYMMAKL